MNILATFIRIIPWMLIAFMLIAPFSDIAPILILHITGAWCLLVHWCANNDICFLTLMEAKLRGIHYKNGFLHKFVAPVYNISDKQISNLCHIAVIVTMMISFYNLLETKAFEKARKCFNNGGSTIECLKILFEK